jgi:hypothetical protein
MTIDEALALEDTTSIIIAVGGIVALKQTLSEAEQTFQYVDELESQVNNGGFQLFFYNYSGDFSLETLVALETIGATKTTEMLRKAIQLFPAPGVAMDTQMRRGILDKIDKSILEQWYHLDDEYFQCEDNIEELLLKFVRENKEAF